MGHGVQSVMEHSLCQKDVLLAWSVVILNAGSMGMEWKNLSLCNDCSSSSRCAYRYCLLDFSLYVKM